MSPKAGNFLRKSFLHWTINGHSCQIQGRFTFINLVDCKTSHHSTNLPCFNNFPFLFTTFLEELPFGGHVVKTGRPVCSGSVKLRYDARSLNVPGNFSWTPWIPGSYDESHWDKRPFYRICVFPLKWNNTNTCLILLPFVVHDLHVLWLRYSNSSCHVESARKTLKSFNSVCR